MPLPLLFMSIRSVPLTVTPTKFKFKDISLRNLSCSSVTILTKDVAVVDEPNLHCLAPTTTTEQTCCDKLNVECTPLTARFVSLPAITQVYDRCPKVFAKSEIPSADKADKNVAGTSGFSRIDSRTTDNMVTFEVTTGKVTSPCSTCTFNDLLRATIVATDCSCGITNMTLWPCAATDSMYTVLPTSANVLLIKLPRFASADSC